MKGKLFVVSGPSGVGKNTLLNAVIDRSENVRYSVSATSRPIRPGEVDGKSYYFVSRERFEALIADDALLEYAQYVGNYYGTPLAPIREAIANGIDVVMDVEVVGALKIKKRLPEEEIAEKYRNFERGRIRILDRDGEAITAGTRWENTSVLAVSKGDNPFGWRLEYRMDERIFGERILEQQSYLVVGAIASLILICQASIFISHSITRPIRRMSHTCKEIEENKGSYQKYRFEAVSRHDEIGQLAVTFEGLLKNMDNYTKMEYTSRMAATLAHEIKNPIAGIRSGIQLLKGRTVKDGDKMLCDSMIHEIDRVTALIMNLLTLSIRRESPKTEISVTGVLKEIGMIYAKGPGSRRASLFVEAEEGLRACLNENEFRQIIHNLISNSLRALVPDREGQIKLMAAAQEKEVIVTVQDNGKGMTEEEVSKALEPFYTKSINGTGLGLSIVSRLVESNGGTMEIVSKPGVGTDVVLKFPGKMV